VPDPAKLPFLLKLLDDESLVVQEALALELSSFGPSLPEALERLPFGLEPEQKEILFSLLGDHQRTLLQKKWKTWQSLEGTPAKLEAAYRILSDFQNGPFHKADLSRLLDSLTEEYRAAGETRDPYRLSQFLFRKKNIRGASEDTYYDAANSNLVYVLESGRGLPISLCAVYLLMGARLGLSIGGCAYPGHFLARTVLAGKTYLVDCFHGAQFMEEDVFWDEHASEDEALLRDDVTAEVWMQRVLRNLHEAFTRSGCVKDAETIRSLIEQEVRD